MADPRRWLLTLAVLVSAWLAASPATAAPCLVVTLTGTMSGPVLLDGCSAVALQFDAGRGTSLRLSQAGVDVGRLDAIFFTHMHSDHTDGFADLMQARWNWNSAGPKLDVVCSTDAASPLGFTLSCQKLVAHIGDAFIESGEIAQRASEDQRRLAGGPAALATLMTFTPRDDPQPVWSKGDVRVRAVRSTHIPGHASYRVDTPAGSVVIGGDAGNDVTAPPRPASTSAQVEALAQGVDVIVHSTMHPIMGPDHDSGMPAPLFLRQSATPDLGAMAQRVGAKRLILTHLAPQVGATSHGPYKVPGPPLTEQDYRDAARAGGFTGDVVVGSDLATVRLPSK